MNETNRHWSNYLGRGFRYGQTATVELEVNPDADHPAMIVLASRIEALYDALKRGEDGLVEEDTGDLLRLVDHLHRVIGCLTAMEDDVLIELRAREVPAREIATAMQTNHRYVLRRAERIAQARRQGLNTHGFDEADEQ